MSNPFNYDPSLYNQQSANEVLPLLFSLYQPSSIIDVGCGLGSWLNVAAKLGVKDIFGIDASDYNSGSFHIQESAYRQMDLETPIHLDRSFDTCICLEVGEHLHESASDNLVHSLCNLAPVVLFSAAVPAQPGQNHINCQWPEYWQKKFAQNGYDAYDILRAKFWDNQLVEWWYRQNMVLYAKPGVLKNGAYVSDTIPGLIHPELYQLKLDTIQELQTIKEHTVFNPSLPFALRSLAKAVLVTPWKKK
ncbi:MAG TPA: methyltransferase domain-containing protein [Phnomibacter sp.]|nr:methyltransferase domain-containing protein [Phnomibacter sp.]